MDTLDRADRERQRRNEATIRVWMGGLHGWVTVPANTEVAMCAPLGRPWDMFERPAAHGRDCPPDEPAWQTPDFSWSERSHFPPDYPRTR